MLVIFLQSSFAQYFLKDIQQTMSDWLFEISTYADRHALTQLRADIEPYTKDLSAQQRTYIIELTHSREKLEKFNTMYCLGDDKNPFVFGTTLKVLCGQIQRSSVLGES
ncbi:MAG: hypothetical protein ACFHVJ_02135 [Aestuariibacter sp.]